MKIDPQRPAVKSLPLCPDAAMKWRELPGKAPRQTPRPCNKMTCPVCGPAIFQRRYSVTLLNFVARDMYVTCINDANWDWDRRKLNQKSSVWVQVPLQDGRRMVLSSSPVNPTSLLVSRRQRKATVTQFWKSRITGKERVASCSWGSVDGERPVRDIDDEGGVDVFQGKDDREFRKLLQDEGYISISVKGVMTLTVPPPEVLMWWGVDVTDEWRARHPEWGQKPAVAVA